MKTITELRKKWDDVIADNAVLISKYEKATDEEKAVLRPRMERASVRWQTVRAAYFRAVKRGEPRG
jgi:hypothetical protein